MVKVACLGIQIVDILGRPVSGIPEGQSVALLDEIRITVAGTAAGTAVDLAKLGAEVYAMGAVGTDSLGDFIIDTYQRYGDNTSGLVRKPGVQTSATMLPIRPNGERPALHVIGANGEMTFETSTWTSWPRWTTCTWAERRCCPSWTASRWAACSNMQRRRGSSLPSIRWRSSCPTCRISEPLPALRGLLHARLRGSGHDVRPDRRALKSSASSSTGERSTVFKMGGSGSSVAYRQDGQIAELRIPVFKVPVVDSTGCGDAYCAGFIRGLSMGWNLEKAALLGSAAAALVITGLGSDAGIVDLEHTIDFMNTAELLPMTDARGGGGAARSKITMEGGLIMKKFINDPFDVVDEMLEGYLAVNGRYVRKLETARTVVRADAPVKGKVGVLTGGGSGHKPAFIGFIGKGMLDAVAVGEIFTSPPPLAL